MAEPAGVVLGNLIGKGKKHEEEVISFSKFLVKISIILGIIVITMVLIIRPIAPSFINASEQTAELIKSMLYVSAFLLFFQAITITIFVGILRAGGDTAFCAAIDIATLWICKIGLGLLCAFVLKLHPVLVYLILSSDECVKALITIPRVWKGKWIHYTTV